MLFRSLSLLLAQRQTKAVDVNDVLVTLGTEERHGTQRMQNTQKCTAKIIGITFAAISFIGKMLLIPP